MKHRLQRIIGGVGIAALVLVSAAASAQVAGPDHPDLSPTKGPLYPTKNELRARKLARGFANVVLSPAEIPNQAFREAYRTSPFTGAVVGSGKGVIKGLKRIGIGLWEIATFYAPLNNFEPYIEPEVVFMEDFH